VFPAFPVGFIGDADRDFIQIPQDVQIRQDKVRRALDLAAISCGHGIEPAHAAGATRGRTVFPRIASANAKLMGDVVMDLAHEGSGADTGGISFGDGPGLVDVAGKTGPDGPVKGQGARRGRIGVDSEIRIT